MRRAVLLLAPLLIAIGCSDEESPVSAGSSRDPDTTRYKVSATVLESPDHGPQLCNIVLDSYPPQCGGPDVVGWDWAFAEGEESASATTWGDYGLVGTWDGERLTLTEPPGPRHETPPDDVDLSSPCPEPEGGWRVLDQALTTQETMSTTIDRARTRPTFAGAWLDQPEGATNDPTRLILNFRATGDLEAFETEVRSTWGGALCVSPARYTYAELEDIQGELAGPEVLGSSVDEIGNVVNVQRYVADEATQEEYDTRYGEGKVVVTGWLQPVDE